MRLCVHIGNVDLIKQRIVDDLLAMGDGSRLSVEVKRWVDKRTLSMNALQHCIYADVSKYLISKGRVEWTPDFVKKNLKNKFLGWKDEVFIDVMTGHKIEVKTLRKTSSLDKGESYIYTDQIIDWSRSIGCEIKIPDKCEFMILQLNQNI